MRHTASLITCPARPHRPRRFTRSVSSGNRCVAIFSLCCVPTMCTPQPLESKDTAVNMWEVWNDTPAADRHVPQPPAGTLAPRQLFSALNGALTPDQRRNFVSSIENIVTNISQLSRWVCFIYLLRNLRILEDEDRKFVALARASARAHIECVRAFANLPNAERTRVQLVTAQHQTAAPEQLRADTAPYRAPHPRDWSDYADGIDR